MIAVEAVAHLTQAHCQSQREQQLCWPNWMGKTVVLTPRQLGCSCPSQWGPVPMVLGLPALAGCNPCPRACTRTVYVQL
jgi:hypothetical protein